VKRCALAVRILPIAFCSPCSANYCHISRYSPWPLALTDKIYILPRVICQTNIHRSIAAIKLSPVTVLNQIHLHTIRPYTFRSSVIAKSRIAVESNRQSSVTAAIADGYWIWIESCAPIYDFKCRLSCSLREYIVDQRRNHNQIVAIHN